MINRLIEKIQKTGAPVVAGLDPMLSYVPEHVQIGRASCRERVYHGV